MALFFRKTEKTWKKCGRNNDGINKRGTALAIPLLNV